MNGVHDLGGMDGFGPIAPTPHEPVFHADWEGRVFALTLAMDGHLPDTLDSWRYRRERLDPVTYLTASYYAQWLAVLEQQLDEQRIVTRAELDRRTRRLAKGLEDST